MTNLTLVRPAPIAAPRGAVWASRAAVAVVEAFKRLLTHRPDGPHARADEAEALRRYANSLRATDPGLAADLYAAADRHNLRA